MKYLVDVSISAELQVQVEADTPEIARASASDVGFDYGAGFMPAGGRVTACELQDLNVECEVAQ